jgi:transcriptional regulator with GAF, ATPase, and Fis domain
MGKPIRHVPQETVEAFTSYAWPGNIRELQNLVERAVIRSNDGVLPNPLPASNKNPVPIAPPRGTFEDSSRAVILQALEAAGWVIGGPRGAATRLGLKRTSLITKMKKLGIYRPRHPRDIDEFNQASESEALLNWKMTTVDFGKQ